MGTPIKNNVSKQKRRSSAFHQANARMLKGRAQRYGKARQSAFEKAQSARAKACKQSY